MKKTITVVSLPFFILGIKQNQVPAFKITGSLHKLHLHAGSKITLNLLLKILDRFK